MVTKEFILSYLASFAEYDLERGGFIATRKRHYAAPNVGEPIGYAHADGYTQLKIKGHSYLIHRLVYAWHYKEWPEQIDHINGIRTDNRIENLRAANPEITARNRKAVTFSKGVSFHRAAGKYMARIRIGGKQVFYKLCDTEAEAINERQRFIQTNPQLGFSTRE